MNLKRKDFFRVLKQDDFQDKRPALIKKGVVFVGSQSIGYSKFTTRGWLVVPGADGAGCVSRLLGVSWR